MVPAWVEQHAVSYRGAARWAARLLAAACLLYPADRAEAAEPIGLADLNATANGVLAVLGFSIVPSETASSVAIESNNRNDANYFATQLGGAFTVSEDLPLYLEGFAGFARYDPEFVFSDGMEERRFRVKWNNFAGTVGAGWDFRLNDELVLRPIANFSLGHVESDLSLASRFLSEDIRDKVKFLRNGRLSAYGLGGSLMLDFERRREDYEADVELRYTKIHLQSFAGTSRAVEGSANAETLGLWSRLRVPTGYRAFHRPLRAVGEFSASYLMGDQRFAIGADFLGQVGGGIEFDVGEHHPLYLQRVRLMGRYLFGDGVQGVSLGLGLSW